MGHTHTHTLYLFSPPPHPPEHGWSWLCSSSGVNWGTVLGRGDSWQNIWQEDYRIAAELPSTGQLRTRPSREIFPGLHYEDHLQPSLGTSPTLLALHCSSIALSRYLAVMSSLCHCFHSSEILTISFSFVLRMHMLLFLERLSFVLCSWSGSSSTHRNYTLGREPCVDLQHQHRCIS